MRLLWIAAVLLALTSAGASAATSLPTAFFRLSRLHASSAGNSVSFSVAVNHTQSNDQPSLVWSLAPTGGAACENPGFPGGTRSRNGLVVWEEQGPSFRWVRGSVSGCAGTVSVVAENQYEHCTATVAVTPKRLTSTAPACALGGYAVGFSTLPVPVNVFHTYSQVQAQLGHPAGSAAAAESQIRAALKAQTAAFAVFPPVWFCNFERIFTPIAALQTDFARGASTTAVLDARAADHALVSCASTVVRRAFDALAASPNPQPAALAATLEHYFPKVFGFRFSDLVDRFAAENVALATAEKAAAAGNTSAATAQVAAVARSAGALSTGLDHYQSGIVRLENAHS